MIVGMGAWFCSLTATLMPSWLSMSPELFTLIGVQEVGLWESCVNVIDSECHPLERRLGLSNNLRLARICMCMSDALALLGLLIAIPGLRLVKICGQSRKTKCGMKITAGVLCLMAAVFGLYPVSSLAHATVLEFNDLTIPDALPRWEFGDALFIGWVAGFLHIVTAMLFFASCCSSEEKERFLKLLSRIKN